MFTERAFKVFALEPSTPTALMSSPVVTALSVDAAPPRV
jgi:hypothetical protein